MLERAGWTGRIGCAPPGCAGAPVPPVFRPVENAAREDDESMRKIIILIR